MPADPGLSVVLVVDVSGSMNSNNKLADAKQAAPLGSDVEETQLLAALKAGDEWAFEALVRTHGGRLLAVARRFTDSNEDAQDVVQTAYLNAFRALDSFQGTARLSTWLHRIVVNTALMKLRSKRCRPEEQLHDLLPDFHADGRHIEQFGDLSLPADLLLDRKRRHAAVRSCIARLGKKYRTVLLLRDIEEWSTAETAERLGLSQGAVKTRLHRARQALSTLLRRHHTRPAIVLRPRGAQPAGPPVHIAPTARIAPALCQ